MNVTDIQNMVTDADITEEVTDAKEKGKIKEEYNTLTKIRHVAAKCQVFGNDVTVSWFGSAITTSSSESTVTVFSETI